MAESPELHCLRCNHNWVSRISEPPAQCPKCHSYNWDIEPKVIRERICPTGDYPNISARQRVIV